MARLVDISAIFRPDRCPRCHRHVPLGEMQVHIGGIDGSVGWQAVSPEITRDLHPDLPAILEASARLFAGQAIAGPLPPVLACKGCVNEMELGAVVRALTGINGRSPQQAVALAPYVVRVRSGSIEIARQESSASQPRGAPTPLHELIDTIRYSDKRELIEWEAALAEIVRLCEQGVSVNALNESGDDALWMLADIDDMRVHSAELLFQEVGWYGDDRDLTGRNFPWREVFTRRTRVETAARILVAFGADTSFRHPDSHETRLTRSARMAHGVTTAILLKVGIDPHAKNGSDEDAIAVARGSAAEALDYWSSRQASE